MGNEELLGAISQMMDEKLAVFGKQVDERFDAFGKQVDEKLDQRFDAFGKRMDYLEFKIDHTMKNLDDLTLDMQIMNRDLRRDYRQLNDTLETVVEVLRTHELMPR